jgi:methyl-accepting chemotaxis protein
MQNRRRVRVIDPRFQWKYASLVALTVFLVSALASVTLFFALHGQARERVLHPDRASIDVTWTIFCFAGGWAALMGGVVALVSLVFTQRICGTMFVLQRYFGEIVQGRLPIVRPLRKTDEFKELVAGFGEAVETLKQDRHRLLGIADEALNLARQTSAPGDALSRLTRQLQDERARQQPKLQEGVPQEAAPFLAEMPRIAPA